LDINHIIADSLKSLSRLIGEHISITHVPAADLWSIKLDPVQLDQIIMNFAVNARDAMPDGGVFAIETQNVTLDTINHYSIVEFVPGEYVMITFSDTGIGMDQETISHVFEPFFTTKSVGKGTGLGLASIYGIITQNSGFINLTSSLGNGTTFNVYFPRHFATTIKAAKVDGSDSTGCGAILVVEDEDAVRRTTALILKKFGYTVYEAESPRKALELIRDSTLELDLIFTDIVMPEMNGVVLMEQIREIRPNIPYIFASGYEENHIFLRKMLEVENNFIQKPVDFNKLSVLINQLIFKGLN
jgi:CheY-like chemotaxis protein